MSKEEELSRIRRLLEECDREARRAFFEHVRCVNEQPEFIRWRELRRVISVVQDGKVLYPAFQFDEHGSPLPEIERVLKVLEKDPARTEWQNALWFVSENGWLRGKSPAECLRSDPGAVMQAAEVEVMPNEY